MKFIKEINLEYAKVQLFEPNLIRIEMLGNHTVGAKEAKELNDSIGILTQGEKSLILMLGDELTQMDKEGRDFSASEEGFKYTIADAFVVKNLAQKLIADFYLKINKPQKPTKNFNSEEEAIKWLFTQTD